MSSPLQAAIHVKHVESDRESYSTISFTSEIKWNHWTVTSPPKGEMLLITNLKEVKVAKHSIGKLWLSSVRTHSFGEFPYWACSPKFDIKPQDKATKPLDLDPESDR